MKSQPFLLTVVSLLFMPVWAQAPYTSPARSGDVSNASASSSGGQGNGASPQSEMTLFGHSVPFMDPSNNTVHYQGLTFDLANNGLVRARFEKYLNTPPDQDTDYNEYRKLIDRIMREARKSRGFDGSTLVSIGKMLYQATEYETDGDQSGALANAIVNIVYANRSIYKRQEQNREFDKQIEQLARIRNRQNNQNTNRRFSADKKVTGVPRSNELAIAHSVKKEGVLEGIKTKNEVANEATLLAAKTQYQVLLLNMFVQRRFDHVVIGARVYKHLFRDGDTKLHIKENSDLGKMLSESLGVSPTVTVIDSMASNARKDVDASVETIKYLISQNKLGEATERMAEAFALGEFMQSVVTMPMEVKQRIAEYWQCRKNLLSAVNSRDYGKAESIVQRMREMDPTFDDSLPMSYIMAQKNASDLALRNAAKALVAGDDEKFNEEIANAATIWPRNPNIEKSKKQLEEYDKQDSVKTDFRNLIAQKNYRFIAANQKKYAMAVFNDQELYPQLETALTTVAEIDKTIEAVREVMEKDTTFGVYMAYERLKKMMTSSEDFASDRELQKIDHEVTLKVPRFHAALEDAAKREEDREFGSALASYMKAQALYPASDRAQEGIRRITDIVLSAEYPGFHREKEK